MSKLVSPEAPEWAGVLGRNPHDFYALPCYTRLEAAWGGGEAAAYYDSGADLLLPLILREGSSGRDAASPYGYPGVVSSAPAAAVREALIRYGNVARAEGVVTSFLRLHPRLNRALPAALADIKGVSVVEHGPTVSVDVGKDAEAWIAARPSRSLRRNIRSLIQQGYTARFGVSDEVGVFVDCYQTTMGRLNAGSTYLYDCDYIEGFLNCLGGRASICVVTGPEGDPACAGLFTCQGEIGQYHLSGTYPEHFAAAPTQLMLLAAQQWVQASGGLRLHLGGGVGGQRDSLFEFKSRFSRDLTSFVSVRMIHDAGRYESLCRMWLSEHDRPGFPSDDFFPLYGQGA